MIEESFETHCPILTLLNLCLQLFDKFEESLDLLTLSLNFLNADLFLIVRCSDRRGSLGYDLGLSWGLVFEWR